MSTKPIHFLSIVLLLGLVLTSAASAADPNLVGWWKLDDGSGTSASDSSGNGSHNTVYGGALWEAGKIRAALHLSGSSNYVQIPFNERLRVLNRGDFTLSLWVSTDEIDKKQIVFQQGDLNGPGRSWLTIGEGTNDNALRSYLGGAWTSSGIIVEAQEWYHATVVVTEGGATDSIQMYVNGEPAGNPRNDAMEDCEGVFIIGSGKGIDTFLDGLVDDVRIYSRGLTQQEIQEAMIGVDPSVASEPSPADQATDVLRDVVLKWTPGESASTHDVYFGANLDDVNSASVTVDPAGVYQGGQDLGAYAVAETLDFGQTYYWRVDEVNGAPDHSVSKGNVWRFEVEPFSIPVTHITVTASSAHDADMVPEKTIDGSGLDTLDRHSNEAKHMWLSGAGVQPVWIQYEFDRAYKLHEMWVWNSNQAIEAFVGLGAKDVTIEISTNGTGWTQLEGTPQFAQAPGSAGYAHNTTIDLGGSMAKYVKLTVDAGYGMLPQSGLSEVRFLYIPTFAREAQPAETEVTDTVDVVLNWRAGREASSHEVYLGTDSTDLALVDTVDENSAAVGHLLDYASTYYWQIVEVNGAELPTSHSADVWSFTTPAYGIVDNFDQYDDDCDRIFFAWQDGLGHNGAEEVDDCDVAPSNGNGSGSIVGHAQAPFAEQGIVHAGRQSMPLAYDSGVSEATIVPGAQDWTANGIKTLSLFFRGEAANTGRLYVKINGQKLDYDGDPLDIKQAQWHAWNIDLTSVGNLQNVNEFTIGIEGASAAGTVYIDDIRLYPRAVEVITPVEPDMANLIAHYSFDGNANDSVGGLHGALVGIPTFVPGKSGQAISLNTNMVTDYVEISAYKGILGANPITVTAWINTTSDATGAIIGWGPNIAGQRFGFRVNAGRLRTEHHGGNVQGDSPVNNGEWQHVAVTVQANSAVSYPEVQLWLNGLDDTRPTRDPEEDAYNITADLDVRIGSRPASDDRYFIGQIDDLRIYARALSQAEIAGLAGRTELIYKPL